MIFYNTQLCFNSARHSKGSCILSFTDIQWDDDDDNDDDYDDDNNNSNNHDDDDDHNNKTTILIIIAVIYHLFSAISRAWHTQTHTCIKTTQAHTHKHTTKQNEKRGQNKKTEINVSTHLLLDAGPNKFLKSSKLLMTFSVRPATKMLWFPSSLIGKSVSEGFSKS